MGSPDVIVVGAGAVGLFTALELAQAGMRVHILEKNSVGRQSSWAGGGILSPLHPWRYPAPIMVLSSWAQRRYPLISQELSDATGIDPEWTRSGLLIVETAEAEAAQGWAQRAGEVCELLDSAQLKSCEPACGLNGGAVFLPGVAQIRNPRLLKALHARLLATGITVEESAQISRLLLTKTAVSGVSDGRRNWRAGCVIIAAGAWSGELLKGINETPPIKPVKGQMLLFGPGRQMLQKILLRQDCYLIPRNDGRILVGSTVEHAGFDNCPTEAGLNTLQSAAFRLLPALGEHKLEAHWAGLRPGSPEGVPYIGRHPVIEGLYINAGHFRHGLLTAPASARLLADIVLQRTPAFDPAPYGWSR